MQLYFFCALESMKISFNIHRTIHKIAANLQLKKKTKLNRDKQYLQLCKIKLYLSQHIFCKGLNKD